MTTTTTKREGQAIAAAAATTAATAKLAAVPFTRAFHTAAGWPIPVVPFGGGGPAATVVPFGGGGPAADKPAQASVVPFGGGGPAATISLALAQNCVSSLVACPSCFTSQSLLFCTRL